MYRPLPGSETGPTDPVLPRSLAQMRKSEGSEKLVYREPFLRPEHVGGGAQDPSAPWAADYYLGNNSAHLRSPSMQVASSSPVSKFEQLAHVYQEKVIWQRMRTAPEIL